MTSIVQLGGASLALQKLPVVAKPVPAPVHHLIAIDISGSMYSDLPELRTHLKNKLATLVGVNDTVSLIWFSGRGQCGTLVEAMKVNGVADLSTLHAAIDRYLVATGLTGFKEPLEMAGTIVDRLKAKAPAALFNLFFLTDGYENQSPEKDVLAVCKAIAPKLDTAAIIEYGYYCNRPLLTKMAEILGGKLVFSEDFQSYAVAFEGAMSGSTKKVPVKLDYAPSTGYVFALAGENLLTFTPDADNVVMVPEGLTSVAYFTDGRPTIAGLKEIARKPEKFDHTKHTDALIFASLVPLAQRMETDSVFSVLGALGDVALVNTFSSAFSKEDYSRFEAEVLAAAADPAKRYVAGYDPAAVPKEDAYTVLELLSDLSGSADNLFYPYHSAFAYERIGAARKANDEEVRFEIEDKSKGYPINGLVWSEDRPNVSVRVRVDGKVLLPSSSRPAGIPAEIESFIYRNYTVIKDGIVHTRKLPVSLTEATFTKLQANGLLAGETWAAGKVFVLEFPKLPVINRKMVKGTTAKDTFKMVVELAHLKGAQKVFNDWRDRISPKESKKYIALYGEAGAEYLKSVGVTEYNGFNPAGTTVKSGDFYMAKELKIAIKGLSSLPKVLDVENALDSKKKLKISEFVMSDAIKRLDAFMSSDVYTKAADGSALLGTWLEGEQKAIVAKTRELIEQLAQRKFSIVVGHIWFSDMPSLDANSLDIEVPGYGPVTVTATLKDVEVAL
ncbi:vWA domain-containing protein [Paraburkholderia sp. A3RO-2L]|uniref:vWA domain-containing protein n=1 Tax=unclassified Paraburkholderia TaxID=2615204 RepID=UPI003DA8EE55